jgi:hypothetical protein
MRVLDKKKLMPILALMILSATVAGAVVLVTRPILMTGTIIAVQNIQVYSDEACTTVFSSWTLGATVKRGDVVVKDLWIKNTGDADIQITWTMLAPLPTGVTMTATTSTGNWPTAITRPCTIGEAKKATFTLTIGPTAPLGAFSWTLNLNGEE